MQPPSRTSSVLYKLKNHDINDIRALETLLINPDAEILYIGTLGHLQVTHSISRLGNPSQKHI